MIEGAIARLLATGAATAVAVWLVPGIDATSWQAGAIAVVVLTLLNMVVRPIIYFGTFPLIIITLGLFMVVVNAALLRVAASLVDGFDVDGWKPALIGAVIISIVTLLANLVLAPVKRSRKRSRERDRRR